MSVTVCTYNIEHFSECFDDNNEPKTDHEDKGRKLAAVAETLNEIGADLIGLVEAPSHAETTPSNTVEALENFAEAYDLPHTEAKIGYDSDGTQELAVMYDPSSIEDVTHVPGGGRGQSPQFDEEYIYDSENDGIKEIYDFYRPPFEAEVTPVEGEDSFRMILVHAKSKAVYDAMDRLHREQESLRNRRKIFAQCKWVRERVDEWRDDGHKVVVMGDMNDGPSLDYFERQFGKTGVEIVMGDLFEPDKILINAYGRPEWEGDKWVPYTASFRDDIKDDYIEVPIDYVLASPDLEPANGKVWNPDRVEALEDDVLYDASDHFPVSMELRNV